MPAPEPHDWRPPEPLRRRLVRAAGYPVLAGGAVFAVAVIVAIALVMFRPHEPSADVDAGVPATTAPLTGTPAPDSLATGSMADPDGGAETASVVFVHVVGEVHRPGVVELSSGDRVEAAIAAAGGATERAELSGVNLARAVSDGEQIIVPDESGAAEAEAQGAPGAVSDSAPEGDTLINLNTADAAALETLPRIGPSLAQRIIDWRSANGTFSSVEQLLDVSGIGEKTLAGFRDRVTV